MNDNQQRHLDATGAIVAALLTSLAVLITACLGTNIVIGVPALISFLGFGAALLHRLQTLHIERTILTMMRDGFGWNAEVLANCTNGAIDAATLQRHLERLEHRGLIESRRQPDELPTGLPTPSTIYFIRQPRLPSAARKAYP